MRHENGMAFLATALALSHAVYAVPGINFPINSQVPPVAQVSKPFSFVFSDSTFLSTESNLTYSLLDSPSWLHLNSTSRSLSGIPASNDVGTVALTLAATDESGTTDMAVTLVVTGDSGPGLGVPIFPQLARYGATSSPETLLLYPVEPFSFAFGADAFSNVTENTIYYAISGDNSPLPSWAEFNEQSLSFSGTSPSLVSPASSPQTFTFKLIASDTAGFAGAIATFKMVVGYHVLAFNSSLQVVDFIKGRPLNTTDFRAQLTLDGEPARDESLKQVHAQSPDWLTLDQKTLSLNGIPPQDATDQNVTITVFDVYEDATNITITLIAIDLFVGIIPSVNATIGQDFNYSISRSLLRNASVHLDVDLGSASTWMTYDPSQMSLQGRVPSNLVPQVINLTFIANEGSVSEKLPFPVHVVQGAGQSPLASLTSTARPKTTTNPSPQSNIDTTSDRGRRKKIIIGTVVGTVGLLLAVALVLLLCFKRRRRRSKKKRLSPSQKQISRPVIREEAIQPEMEENPEVQPRSELQRLRTPTPTPKLDLGTLLGGDTFRRSGRRLSRTIDEEVGGGHSSFDFFGPDTLAQENDIPESSSGMVLKTESQDLTPFRLDGLNYSRKRTPHRPVQPRKRETTPSMRSSRALSGLSSRSSGLQPRLSGAGHGAGGFGPPGWGLARSSWRNTESSMPSEESGVTSNDGILEFFPKPPKAKAPTSSDEPKRASLRMVSYPSQSRMSMAEQRQGFIRDRARDKARGKIARSIWEPAGTSTRLSSGSRTLDRAWRSPSLAPTGISASIYPEGLSRRHTQRSYSQSSSVEPPLRPGHKASHGNLGARFRDGFSRLSRFRSDTSLSSHRFDSADSSPIREQYDDLVDVTRDSKGQKRWYQVRGPSDSCAPSEQSRQAQEKMGTDDPSGTSHSQGSRAQRLSTYRTNLLDPTLLAPPGERSWKLVDDPGKRPASIEPGDGFPRSKGGSQKADLAFL